MLCFNAYNKRYPTCKYFGSIQYEYVGYSALNRVKFPERSFVYFCVPCARKINPVMYKHVCANTCNYYLRSYKRP